MKIKLYARALVVAPGPNGSPAVMGYLRKGVFRLFGGRVRKSENGLEAIKRELLEETGYDSVIARLAGISEHTVKRRGRKVKIVEVLYEVAQLQKQREPDEGFVAAWLPLEEFAATRATQVATLALAVVRARCMGAQPSQTTTPIGAN